MNKRSNPQPQRVQPAAPQAPNALALAAASAAAPLAPPTEAPSPSASIAPGETMPAPEQGAVDHAAAHAVADEAERGPGRVRIPFGSSRQKLDYPPRPGFHRHWFNDTPGRVDRAKAAGYEHVLDARGQPVSQIVGVSDGASGLLAFLMEQPQHWHDEDVALGQKPVDDIDFAIKHGAIGREKDGGESDVRYQPQGRGIKITAR